MVNNYKSIEFWNIEKALQKSKEINSRDGVKAAESSKRQKNYDSSYHAILKFSNAAIDNDQLLLLLNMVYGWMPRVARICDFDSFTKLVAILEQVRMGKDINNDDLVIGVNAIGSLVGLSKILHFIAPYRYSIFDSRIVSAFTTDEGDYIINKIAHSPGAYLAYNAAVVNYSILVKKELRSIEKKLFGYIDDEELIIRNLIFN
jgi:hypothetical protein